MNQKIWKEVLLKNRDVCNNLVFGEKKTNSHFAEEILAETLAPFFDSLPETNDKPGSEVIVLSHFQTLLTLISKNFFKQNHPIPSLFFETIQLFGPLFKENLTEPISYLANVLVKIEDPKKELFLKRIHSFAPFTSSVGEWKTLLTVFAWASGKPEYRLEAKTQFDSLSLTLKKEISRLVGITEETLSHPFPKRNNPPKETDPVHFRVVPGYTLFGGSFQEIPSLYSESDSVVVVSGPNCFSLYLDQFGTNVIPKEIIQTPQKPNGTIRSPFWKLIVSKKLDLKEILSAVESEESILLTIPHSYNIYLFYLGST
ncbi:hypothetical protein [Leptospira perdikensis]|uniref:Uncharacterized protein n=1 Tax=Leptospira perdikensis TaxID=2484948 RepID=A0A4R9JHA2_9LEPT|nr:hypothetical protein [Leptospira perdikensis]TGL39879.1 hypothetical protein EHQ49_10900 [Leptospira perdikensis]